METKTYKNIRDHMAQNKKNLKIKKLWDRGVTDLSIIARKIGYTGNAITAGVERVKEGLKAQGVNI